MRIGKTPGFKLISLKEHQIWENQFHELNTYEGGIEGHIQLDVDITSSPNGTAPGSLNMF